MVFVLYSAKSLNLDDALNAEYRYGIASIESGETRQGAARFAAGEGGHGRF
jgi:enoyl-CoA hydratase